MRLYSERGVRELAKKKAQFLGVPFTPAYPTGDVFVLQATPAQIEGMMTPGVRNAMAHLFPDQKPLVKHEYVSKDPSEPPIADIKRGCCYYVPTNIKADDACLLFCASLSYSHMGLELTCQ